MSHYTIEQIISRLRALQEVEWTTFGDMGDTFFGEVADCIERLNSEQEEVAKTTADWFDDLPEKAASSMLKVAGEPFRCGCGCNVFARKGKFFKCNACEEVFKGD